MELSKYLHALKHDKCPTCGSESFDLDNNQHEYLDTTATDVLVFSCECGAVWTETWRLESVFVTDSKFYTWSVVNNVTAPCK